MSLTKVFWYMLRVKNMYIWSPSDFWNRCGKATLSYLQNIIRLGEAKLCILELISVFYHLPSVGSKQLCAFVHLGYTPEVF